MVPNLNDERLFDAIIGSGCTCYGWYTKFKIDEERRTVTVAFEDDASQLFDVASLRGAFQSLLEINPNSTIATCYNWTDPECDSDVDADIADCVLQIAYFGELVYA